MRASRPLVLLTLLSLAGCSKPSAPSPTPVTTASSATGTKAYAGVARADFNRVALDLNLPLYWTRDRDGDGAVDPDEVASLLFYPGTGHWVEGGRFTPEFDLAYERIGRGAPTPPASLPADEQARRRLVIEDLEQGAPTLIETDLRSASQGEKSFVRQMLGVALLIDDLHATMTGAKALAAQVPADDSASQALFRRDWGPRCRAPKTQQDKACSAIPGAPLPICDGYPPGLQKDEKFCRELEAAPAASALLDHFVVVRDQDGGLTPVRYATAYQGQMVAIAKQLHAAAAGLTDPAENLLRTYLTAAAESFETNDWEPSNEAWARMNAQSSKWYLRVAPDEVYWDPCNHKAGFHMTFARINPDSLRWQGKLAPIEEDMERTLAALIGAPYAPRKVSFHLPDFIDILWNAGDDRMPLGATIGQSLPNWGKVVAEGRARTVAMSNMSTDPDSLAVRRKQASSLLDADSMASYVDSAEPGLLATILHEATHNLGPSHEYAYKGRIDDVAFGGSLATMLEELKAQSGALYFVELLKRKGIISSELAAETYADAIAWSFGHVSRGMYTAGGGRMPYGQLAAIQLGMLLEEGALTWNGDAPAANGTDKGAFTLHADKLPAAVETMMKQVGRIKATNDKAAADELVRKFVDGDAVPQKVIAERVLRFPKPTFVYAVEF